MIKKIKTLIYTLIITGIFLITGINTTNGAGAYTTIGLDKYNSAINSQFKLGFLKGGALLTEYLGQGKSILAMDNNILFRRAPNGQPYFYSPNMQGFFSHYAVCDYMSSTNSGLQNCSMSPLTGDYKAMLKGFFSKVKPGDIAYYNYEYTQGGVNCSYHHYYITVCRSSEEIGNTLCFNYQNCYNGCNLNQCSNYCRNGLCGGGLINSQNLQDLNRGLVSNSRIGYAPGQNGYDGQFEGSSEGSAEGFINNQLTGDYTYADCTWNDILIALESEGYNKYVCYGGLDDFDLYDSSINYNPIAGNGLSISQIWAWSGSRAWDNFPEWFTFWNGLYLDSSNNNYNSMWESYPAVYRTYFQIYNAYKGSVLDPRTVLEYCQLRTLTGNQLNNSAGGYFKPVCETVVREKQTGLWDCRVNGTLYSGCEQNPQVAIGTNWNGVGNMSGVTAQSDGLNFIQNFFNLAKSNLLTNYSGSPFGIIPSYIVIFMIALILFRFISH